MEIQFYHLLTTPLAVALPKLLEKAYASNARVIVKAADAAQMKELDALLWSYHPDSFLPHGCENEDAAQQPIVITVTAEENRNKASIMVVVDSSAIPNIPEGVGRVLDIFDGGDERAVLQARERWKYYKDQGFVLSYIKQQPNGGWKKEA